MHRICPLRWFSEWFLPLTRVSDRANNLSVHYLHGLSDLFGIALYDMVCLYKEGYTITTLVQYPYELIVEISQTSK